MPDNDDDAPRWELRTWNPSSDDLSRWKPESDVPRMRPRRSSPSPVRPLTPPARATNAAARPHSSGTPRPATAGARREARRRPPPLAAPFAWWAKHPWAIVWALVVLAPPAALALRLIDDAGLTVLVSALTWSMGIAVVLAVALAAMVSAARSPARAMSGTVAAATALGLALGSVTSVTLGPGPCPAHAGPDLGAGTGASALNAWRTGTDAGPMWLTPGSAAAWAERTRDVTLVGYRLLASGCWERVAPIDATRTWHEFRVTVRGADGLDLSKAVVIHTEAEAGGWKIGDVEGPLP